MTDDFLNLSRPHEHPWPDRAFPCMHLVQKLLLKKQEAWPGLRGVPTFEKNDRNSVSRLNERSHSCTWTTSHPFIVLT